MDIWDIIGLFGTSLIVAGVACIYWPAGLICAGAAILVVYALREYANHVPDSRDNDG